MKKRAVIVVTGEPNAVARPMERPRTIWEHGVGLSPKWRYTLVKPGSWKGLLRGRLPSIGRGVVKLGELGRWNHQRWPGARQIVVIPSGRKLFWRHVAEQTASFSHREVETPDWPSVSRRWVNLIAKLGPGDLVIVDDTLASGQRIWRMLETHAPAGVQLAAASALFPELRLFKPNTHRVVVASDEQADSLKALGFGDAELVLADRGDQRLAAVRRELASRIPQSILLLQPAPDTKDLVARFQLDDELTQLTQLLDQHGYGVRVIGAPSSPQRGAWPVVNWSAGQRSRLAVGWEQRRARLSDAKKALVQHLNSQSD